LLYANEAHFPAPVWAQAVRETEADTLAARRALAGQLGAAIMRRFN
jgi:hypothetical protein